MLAGIGLFVLLVFIGLLYYTLKTKVEDVTNDPPFVNLVGKKMKLGQDAILVNNYEPFVYEEPLLLDKKDSPLYEGTTIAFYVKKGDELQIRSAKNFTNGTSGATHTILFGTIITGSPSKTIPFEYYWETQTITKDAENTLIFTFLPEVTSESVTDE